MDIATLTDSETMDSRDIARITGKEHGHVCRDIQKMLEDLGEGGESRFGSSYLSLQNKEVKRYCLPKRECLILASGYSVPLRAKIIDRWAELESQAAFKVPQTLSEALRLAADLSDRVEAQATQLEAQKPAVAFVERFVEAKETQNLRVVAKVLQIKEKDFVSLLLSNGILFRSRGKLTPKAEHMEAGRFEVKEIVTRDGFATVQMRFTTAGVEWIARKVAEWGRKASPVALEAPTASHPVPTGHLDAGRA